MQGKNVLTGLILAVLLLICGLAGAKAWAESAHSGVPAQQVGSTSVTTTPSQAAVTSGQGAATGSSEGTEASDPATTSGQQTAEPEDGGPDSAGDGWASDSPPGKAVWPRGNAGGLGLPSARRSDRVLAPEPAGGISH